MARSEAVVPCYRPDAMSALEGAASDVHNILEAHRG